MLRKHTGIEITADDPFANDCLERKLVVERLTRLIRSTNQAFVLAIDSPWGWGKTTFVQMWQAYLESKGHPCLYFNAWQNDFVDDPLLALIGELQPLVDPLLEEMQQNQSAARAHWERVKRIGAGVLRKAVPVAAQIATQGLLTQDTIKKSVDFLSDSSEEVSSFASDLAKERLEGYASERTGMKAFCSSLGELASLVVGSHEDKRQLLIFVDELDRCRPDFAVALLERLKHLFSVRHVVFVLAVDRRQLGQSVKALYGPDLDADGYLRRFIDLWYRLPEPSTANFADLLLRRFELEEVLTNLDPQRSNAGGRLVSAFAGLSKAFNLSLRAQEQCFIEVNLAARTIQTGIYPEVLAILALLKTARQDLYSSLEDKSITLPAIVSFARKIDETELRAWTEATLMSELARNVWNEHIAELDKTRRASNGEEGQIASRTYDLASLLINARPVPKIISCLRISEDFS